MTIDRKRETGTEEPNRMQEFFAQLIFIFHNWQILYN